MDTAAILEKLTQVEAHYDDLERQLADPMIAMDFTRLRELAQERSEIAEVVQAAKEWRQVVQELATTREMLSDELDEQMRALVEGEVQSLEESEQRLEHQIQLLLLPKDPNDDRDVIVEIRAGTGGDEAALFASDLYRMYSRYAESQGWKSEMLSSSPTGIGGFKEIIFQIEGRGAYSQLKHESGVHRVQRVPETEASGRIHTSTATVAVLPDVDEVDVQIAAEDIRIDVFRAKGHGGQGVNTTDSAVRITHLPTGLVVTCQDERSQLQNKMRAMSILRARLYDIEQNRQDEEVGATRRAQVGTGERSEKVRTYNFPQSRVTDHRINLSSYRLQNVLAGELQEFIDQLVMEEQAQRLRTAGIA